MQQYCRYNYKQQFFQFLLSHYIHNKCSWVYFKRCFEMFDLFIVLSSTLLTIIYILLMGEDGNVMSSHNLVLFG